MMLHGFGSLRWRTRCIACAVVAMLLPAVTVNASALQASRGPPADGQQASKRSSNPDATFTKVRQAIGGEQYRVAVELSSSLLGETDDIRAEALLYRALSHFRLDDRVSASRDLRMALVARPQVDALFGAGSRADGAAAPGTRAWPDDFLNWGASIRGEISGASRAVELPDVSLEDLNIGAPVKDVASHFVMDVEIVRIPVIVEDDGGGFMAGLEADDFAVSEGTRAARKGGHLISEREPTSVGILVDASSPIAADENEIRIAVADLIQSLRPEDEVFLIQFGEQASFLSPFTTDRAALESALQGYRPKKGRALYDAVALGLIQMRSAYFDKKALIIVAHGDDSSSQTSEADVRLAARREGVAIHAIVVAAGTQRWRPSLGESETSEASAATGSRSAVFLQELVHNTGGLVALRPGADQRFGGLPGWLSQACTDITDYVNHQYLILYRSTSPPPRGRWRSLAVDVAPRHRRVRARSGYVR